MDKLRYMKTPTQSFREFLRPTKYLYQPKFEDKILKVGPRFQHTWAQMAHMHDLRVWVLTYAPANKGNIQKLQEIHKLNSEMWYQYFSALCWRVVIAIPLLILLTRFGKHRFIKNYNTDSHDACFREVVAHM